MSSPHSMKTGGTRRRPGRRSKPLAGARGQPRPGGRHPGGPASRAGADDDDVGRRERSVGGLDGDGAGRAGELTSRRLPVRTSKRPAWRSARRQASAANTPESGSTSTGPDKVDTGEPPCGCCGRDLLHRRTRGRQRAGDGVQRRLVAKSHLPGDMEQPAARGRFEVVPARAGQERHFDVVRLGIAEAEDPGVALGAGTLVAGCRPASRTSTSQPRRARAQALESPSSPAPTTMQRRCVGHAVDHTNGRSPDLAPRGARQYARRGDQWDGRVDGHRARHHPEPEPEPERPAVAAEAGRGRVCASTVLRARRLPPRGPRLFHRSRHRPVVARLDRPPERHPDLPLRRSGPASLVHRLARLRHHALHNLVFSQRGERPPRRQPALEHVGHPRRRRARPRHVGLGPRHRHQRGADPGPGPERLGLLRGLRPLVSWKAGAIPAALVFGYSAAMVTSLIFGHVSVTVLVIPPFLFTRCTRS